VKEEMGREGRLDGREYREGGPLCIIISTIIASDSSDYLDPGTLSFVFDRNNPFFEVMIPLINDDIHELDENFFVSLSSSEDTRILMIAPADATIIIQDDEGT
jgi:hypothetical protein